MLHAVYMVRVLYLVACEGYTVIVKMLMDYGAAVDLTDKMGNLRWSCELHLVTIGNNCHGSDHHSGF